MKKFFILAAVAVLSLGFYASQATADTHAGQFAKPDYYAVTFYSGTCGSCKILDPAIKQARGDASLDSGDVLFVTMDFSNKASINQSKLKAAALGLDSYVKSAGAKTGYMVLLDAEAQELAKFTKADDAAAIATRLKTAMAE